MIIHDVLQNTPEWDQLRLGIPTASAFSKILTPKGEKSEQSSGYMNLLIAEQLAGEPLEGWSGNKWTDRGHALEDEAIFHYEMETGQTVGRVGFATNDLAGCSPDGVLKGGGLEVKSPSAAVHISYLLGNKCPTIHLPQVQGSMWIFDVEWWDFMSYHPGLPKMIIRVKRDWRYIAALEKETKIFKSKMNDKINQLQKTGYIS